MSQVFGPVSQTIHLTPGMLHQFIKQTYVMLKTNIYFSPFCQVQNALKQSLDLWDFTAWDSVLMLKEQELCLLPRKYRNLVSILENNTVYCFYLICFLNLGMKLLMLAYSINQNGWLLKIHWPKCQFWSWMES